MGHVQSDASPSDRSHQQILCAEKEERRLQRPPCLRTLVKGACPNECGLVATWRERMQGRRNRGGGRDDFHLSAAEFGCDKVYVVKPTPRYGEPPGPEGWGANTRSELESTTIQTGDTRT